MGPDVDEFLISYPLIYFRIEVEGPKYDSVIEGPKHLSRSVLIFGT